MAEAARKQASTATDDARSKKELQRQMERTRESVSETVDEIRETVTRQYEAAKETVAGVLDYREQFQKEPLVWSLGALSAGFALGYTMGYAHKETKGPRQSQLTAFTDTLVDELSVVGNSVVMPALNAHIRELFGFDFSEVLDRIGEGKKTPVRRKTTRKAKAAGRKPAARKKKSR